MNLGYIGIRYPESPDSREGTKLGPILAIREKSVAIKSPDSPDRTQIGPIWAIRRQSAAKKARIAQIGSIRVQSGLSGHLSHHESPDSPDRTQIGPIWAILLPRKPG